MQPRYDAKEDGEDPTDEWRVERDGHEGERLAENPLHLGPLAGLRGLLDGFGQTNLANLHRWLDFRVVMVRMRPEDFAVRLHQIWPGS